MCGAPAVANAILDAAPVVGRADPRPRPDAHGRRRRTAADADDRADRDRARLGVHPDLRAHRDDAAPDDEPQPCRVRRPLARRSGSEAQPRRRPRDRRRGAHLARQARSSPAATTSWTATGTSRKRPPTRSSLPSDDPDGPEWFHTGDGGDDRRRHLRHDQRPQEGRHHLRRRERQLDRGRGRAVQPSGGRRGRGHRRARREVGRAGDGARRDDARVGADRGRADRVHARRSSPATSARSGSSSATCSPAPPPASCRSSSCASRTGTARPGRSTSRRTRHSPAPTVSHADPSSRTTA